MKKIILVLFAVVLTVAATAVPVLAEDVSPVDKIENLVSEQNGLENFELVAVSVISGEENAMILNGKYTDEDKTVEWSETYTVTLEQYLALYRVNNSSLVYDSLAGEGQTVSESVSEIITAVVGSASDDMGVDLNFEASGFMRNIKYMGLGMLGIFVVVGVVIVITFALNSATTKKKA